MHSGIRVKGIWKTWTSRINDDIQKNRQRKQTGESHTSTQVNKYQKYMRTLGTKKEMYTARWKLDVKAHGDLSLFEEGCPSVLRLVQSRTSMGINRCPKHNRVANGINHITNITAHMRQRQVGSRGHRLPVGKEGSHQRMLNRQTKRKSKKTNTCIDNGTQRDRPERHNV